MEITLINEKDHEYAENKLQHFYANEMIPAEKKSYLTELKNNQGPFMGVETESGETHYIMDAASQIATLGLGFSPSVFMGTAHFLSSWTNNPNDANYKKLENALHSFLLRKSGWASMDYIFCNSGAESNEIALGHAFRRRKNKDAKKVLAFEGSFHGRMLVSLFSTWNKSKREPFQWPGFETTFVPYPELEDATIHQQYPENWREFWDNSGAKEVKAPSNWPKDETIKTEIDCLLKVREELMSGSIFSIIIEPMQCEGGDRYSSDRFNTALLIMAKAFQVEVIYDEVQTGFHLGRDFFWHRQFCLTDSKDRALYPDYLVCAKKAQVGMVLSPNPLQIRKKSKHDQFQTASVIRRYLHGLALDQSKPKIISLETKVKKHLEDLINKFPTHLSRPRALGLSFAFDIKDKEKVPEFINRRFEHGLLYYPAGEKTLRFRLNTSFSSKDLDFLFERLDEIADEVYNDKKSTFSGKATTTARSVYKTIAWQNEILKARLTKLKGQTFSEKNSWDVIEKLLNLYRPKDNTNLQVINIDQSNFESFKPQIEKLQVDTYEPTRQTSIERFRVCASSKNSVCIGLVKNKELVGMAFSSSLQDHPLERGIRQDPDFNDPKCLYMIDTTIKDDFQKFGFGRFLKYALTLVALSKNIRSIKGRNRDRLAASMLAINLSLGSFEQLFLREDYPDFEEYRDVVYYQSPLIWNEIHNYAHLGNRLNSLLTEFDLDYDFMKEQLPYITNKVCLSNFVSESFLNHVKWVLELVPKSLRHGYTSSGQSECTDKAFKSIIYNQKDFKGSSKCLTFQGHFFGEGSFLSRSLSNCENDEFFPVHKMEHPTEQNQKELLKELTLVISNNEINSIWIEPTRQEDYSKTPHSFLSQLKEIANKNDIPLVYNETGAQQFTYSEKYYFACNDKSIEPDIGLCFLGGQAGIVFTNEKYFIAKPLMMISTWDGDEHAFATYVKGAKDLVSNKEEFIKVRGQYHELLTQYLTGYPLVNFNIHEGRGLINGPISSFTKDLLKETDLGYLSDPSFGAMKFILKGNLFK